MKKKDKLEQVKEELWKLARELTAAGIPYYPPLKEEQIGRLRTHNKTGYQKLQWYLKLEKLEAKLEKELTVGND